ncbi:MAG: c-type cytochrome biogenesis protein CcsB [Pseudomonadota bacterium]
MNIIFLEITLLLYLLGTAAYLVAIVSQRPQPATAAWAVLVGGFAFHTVALVARFMAAGYTPVTNLQESLSFFAWSIVVLYLVFDFRYQVKGLGAFVSPAALLLMLWSNALPKEVLPLPAVLDSYWHPVHVVSSFGGYALFTLAAAAGLMYLFQEREIKSKKIGRFYDRLPALQVLDTLNHRCISIGFTLLTIGIISGSIWAQNAWGSYWSWDPKETWSLITWFLYAALFHERLAVGWRGRRAAVLAIIGFVAVLFTFFGVSLLLPGRHSYLG